MRIPEEVFLYIDSMDTINKSWSEESKLEVSKLIKVCRSHTEEMDLVNKLCYKLSDKLEEDRLKNLKALVSITEKIRKG